MIVKGMVSNQVKMRKLPIGRYIYALEETKKVAEERGEQTVKEWAIKALKKGRAAMRLQFSYDQSKGRSSTARGDAVKLDNIIDAQIVAIRNLVRARRTGEDDDPVVTAAHEFMGTIFPRGVQAVTQQSFENQLATMNVMLEHFHDDLARHVELLGIEREVTRLEQLVERFRQEMSTENSPVTTYDMVSEAVDELHEYSCIVKVFIIAAHPGLDKASTEAREFLLAPLEEQEERVFQTQQRRRRVLDIDPSTGEEILEGELRPDVNDLLEEDAEDADVADTDADVPDTDVEDVVTDES